MSGNVKKFIPPLPLLAAMAIFCTALGWAGVTRLYELKTSVLDLGVFQQLFWSMFDSGAFISSLNPPYHAQHWLGFHFSPILYLIVPIYAIWPAPETLILINVTGFGLAAVPLYLTARAIGFSGGISSLWGVAYLVNSFVLSAAAWDFHEVALAAPIMGFALYAVVTRNIRLMLTMAVLLMLCKEHYGLSVLGFGLLWGWVHQDKLNGGMLALFGTVGFLTILLVLMPAFGSGEHHMFASGGSHDRFSWLLNPSAKDAFFWQMFVLGSVFYLGFLLLPFWFLPLRSIVWLLPAMGDVAVNLLSSNEMLRSMHAYHSATLIPVLMVAAMQTTRHITGSGSRLSAREVICAVLAAQLALGYCTAPIPLSGSANIWETGTSTIRASDVDIQAIRSLLPRDQKVSLQTNIGVFFSDRSLAYEFPGKLDEADAIILHLHYPFVHSRSLFGIPFNLLAPDFIEQVKILLADPTWGILYWQNHWLVLKRNAPSIHVDRATINHALERIRHDYSAAGKKR